MKKLLLTLLCIVFVGALGRAQDLVFSASDADFAEIGQDEPYTSSWSATVNDWQLTFRGFSNDGNGLLAGATGNSTSIISTEAVPYIITEVSPSVRLVNDYAGVESVTLTVFSNAAMTNVVYTETNSDPGVGEDETPISFQIPEEYQKTGQYYRLEFSISNPTSSNGVVELMYLDFYGEEEVLEVPGWGISKPANYAYSPTTPFDPASCISNIPDGLTIDDFSFTVKKGTSYASATVVDPVDGKYILDAYNGYFVEATSKEIPGKWSQKTANTTTRFQVTKVTPVLTWTPTSATVKIDEISSFEQPVLSVTPYEEALAGVTYSSSDVNVAKVDTDGKITIVGVGEAKIEASRPADTNYNRAIQKSFILTVQAAKEVAKPVISPAPNQYNEINLAEGQNTISFTADNADKFTWTITGAETRTGEGNTITFSTGGKFNVTVYAWEGETQSSPVSVTVNIPKANPIVKFANPDGFTFHVGETTEVENVATVEGWTPNTENPTISYSFVRGGDLATLSQDGKVTIKENVSGVIEVRASVASNGLNNSSAATYEIHINKYTPELAWSAEEGANQELLASQIDDVKSYTATVNAESVSSEHVPAVTYAATPTGENAIGTVDATTGKVTLNGNVGSLTITASTVADTWNEAAQVLSYTITVGKATPSLKIIESNIELKVATTDDVTYDPSTNVTFTKFAGNAKPKYSLGNTNVATINPETGVITLLNGKTGQFTVRVRFDGDENNNASVPDLETFNINVTKYAPVLAWGEDEGENLSYTAAEVATEDFAPKAAVAAVSDAAPEHVPAVTYTAAPAEVGSVDENGKVTLTGAAGVLTVTASTAADAYNDATTPLSYTISVQIAQPVITVPAQDINTYVGTVEGQLFETQKYLKIEENVGDIELTYAITRGADIVKEISNGGVITLNSGVAGQIAVSVSFKGNDRNAAVAAQTFYINVEKYAPTFAWTEEAGTRNQVFNVGEAADVKSWKAELTYPEGVEVPEAAKLSVVYSATESAAGSVDPATGEVTLTGKAGSFTVTATPTGSADFSIIPAPLSYSVEVSSAVPVIALNTEAPATLKVATEAEGKEINLRDYVKFEKGYNDNDIKIVFTIASGSEIATIEGETLTLENGKTGNVNVKAVTASNDWNIASNEIFINLTVEKYKPTLTLNGESATYTAGYEDSYTETLPTIEFNNGGYESLEPEYTYNYTGNITAASINDGEITINPNSDGSYTVTATVAESDYNDAATATYTITVLPAPTAGTFNFTDNSTGWLGNDGQKQAESALITLIASNRFTLNEAGYLDVAGGSNATMLFRPQYGYKITSVVFKGALGGDVSGVTTATAGTWNNDTWTNTSEDAGDVTFTFPNTTSIESITVNFEKNIPSVIKGLVNGAQNTWSKDGVLLSDEALVTDVNAVNLVKATVQPVGKFTKGSDRYFLTDYTWWTFTQKQYGEKAAEKVLDSDSWFYTADEVGVDAKATIAINEEGKVSINVPCSGTYRVTLQMPEDQKSYKAETVSFNFNVMPDVDADGAFVFNGVNILSVLEGDTPTGERIVPIVTTTDGEYSRKKVQVACNILGANLSYGVVKATTAKNGIRRAPENFTNFNDNFLNLEDASAVALRASKNGVTATSETYPVYDAEWTGEPGKSELKVNGGDITVGVDGIDQDGVEVEYYTLDGVRINAENLVKGIYIMRRGNDVKKIMVR
ncbi:MAG: hypothetical protein K2N03_01170 [Muribaculaceae bacterium]|nr:hypothetical protein [Muribaculaceae bacterium]